MALDHRESRQSAGHPASDDALWLAFRYLHGELSADEAEAFEEQLAVEQPAREALAEATRLSEIAQAAFVPAAQPASQVVRTPSGGTWRRAASWFVVGTAACLAFFLAWNAVWTGGSRDVVDNGPGPINLGPINPTNGIHTAQLLAQALPSGMDAWPITEVEVLEPSEDDAAAEAVPALADDWIALAVIAAQGSEKEKR